MSQRPRVSAIVLAYNYGRYLARSIESVLGQDYPSELVQVIVVDDGSEDDTPEVARSFGDRIEYVRKPHGGLLTTVDRGLEEARGEFIALQSADDIWLPNKLRSLTEVLEARREVGLVYGDMAVIDVHENLLHPSYLAMSNIRPRRGRVLGPLIRGNFVSGGGLMVRASLRDRFHPLPDHAGWEDWWIAVRVSEVAEIEFVPCAVHGYRRHDANMNLGADQARAMQLAIEEMPFRRWLLTDLHVDATSGVSASDLLAAWQAFLYCARLAAARDGSPDVRAAVGVTDWDQERSHEAVAGAEARLAGDDVPGAVREAVRALGHDPQNVFAHQLLALLQPHIVEPQGQPLEFPVRSFVTFAHEEEIAERPELLRAYASAFDGSDDATLLIALPAAGTAEAADRLTSLVAELGIEDEHGADMVASVVVAGDHASLAARVGAVLSARQLPGPLGTIVRSDDAACEQLARWARTQAPQADEVAAPLC